jgi:hypothetical protein
MVAQTKRQRITSEEYLMHERESETKSEYYDGVPRYPPTASFPGMHALPDRSLCRRSVPRAGNERGCKTIGNGRAYQRMCRRNTSTAQTVKPSCR